jgi:hypothetical protein
MSDANNFFLLAKKEILNSSQSTIQSFVYISSDAQQWDGPFLISENEDITRVKHDHGLTIAFNTNLLFSSMDDGRSWSKRIMPLDGNIEDIAVPDANIIYAVIGVRMDESQGQISSLVKSADGGNSWQIMEREFYGDKASFFDEEHGIAMAKGSLQVTHDGGNTWKLILVSSN